MQTKWKKQQQTKKNNKSVNGHGALERHKRASKIHTPKKVFNFFSIIRCKRKNERSKRTDVVKCTKTSYLYSTAFVKSTRTILILHFPTIASKKDKKKIFFSC